MRPSMKFVCFKPLFTLKNIGKGMKPPLNYSAAAKENMATKANSVSNTITSKIVQTQILGLVG